MNPFLLSLDDRLRHWKELRKSLANYDELSQLSFVAKFWSQAPLVSIAYDPNDASGWPTPWEMMRNNEWCRNSIAIGMDNTLRLSDFPCSNRTLQLILDRGIQEMLLVLNIDDKWLLNYDWGHVKPYQKSFNVIKSWRFLGKSYSLSD